MRYTRRPPLPSSWQPGVNGAGNPTGTGQSSNGPHGHGGGGGDDAGEDDGKGGGGGGGEDGTGIDDAVRRIIILVACIAAYCNMADSSHEPSSGRHHAFIAMYAHAVLRALQEIASTIQPHHLEVRCSDLYDTSCVDLSERRTNACTSSPRQCTSHTATKTSSATRHSSGMVLVSALLGVADN